MDRSRVRNRADHVDLRRGDGRAGSGAPAGAGALTGERSLHFGRRPGGRYWWHRLPGSAFVPPVYATLSDEEWDVLAAWFDDTDGGDLIGEVNVPAMCVLQGFLMGSLVRNVVQLGACAGYSTLLTGFMMRRMGLPHAVVAIDIDPRACAYCERWIARAGLGDHVRVECGDSVDPGAPARARAYFGGPLNLVLIDSSHRYAHTLAELDLWAAALNPGGFLFLHDTSEFATRFDPSGEGGVRRAFEEWIARNPAMRAINVSNSLATLETPAQVYKDGCGLGIVQKPS